MARAYQIKTYRKQSLSISLPPELAQLRSRLLDPEIKRKTMRSAAYAGAKILYDEMRFVVPIKEGTLHDSIFHWFDTKSSTPNRQTYLIGPNKVDAPHWHFVEFGHWIYNRSAGGKWLRSKSRKSARVENPPQGWSSVHDLPGARKEAIFWKPAKGFVRRTWDNKGQAAIDAAVKRANDRFIELLKGSTT